MRIKDIQAIEVLKPPANSGGCKHGIGFADIVSVISLQNMSSKKNKEKFESRGCQMIYIRKNETNIQVRNILLSMFE